MSFGRSYLVKIIVLKEYKSFIGWLIGTLFVRLEVQRIREFNVVLLAKWWWRMRVENRSLWYRVYVDRYGEV
jgi:hypothetical protein